METVSSHWSTGDIMLQPVGSSKDFPSSDNVVGASGPLDPTGNVLRSTGKITLKWRVCTCLCVCDHRHSSWWISHYRNTFTTACRSTDVPKAVIQRELVKGWVRTVNPSCLSSLFCCNCLQECCLPPAAAMHVGENWARGSHITTYFMKATSL